jgi:uncharacterized protein YxeA
MTRLQKCEFLKSKGYDYDPDTGKIFGVKGKEIIGKHCAGYILLMNGLLGHHFAWYMTYGNVDFIELDHKNRIRYDNKIDNLRILTRSEQRQNSTHKGYSWNKIKNKYQSYIKINGKKKSLGYFYLEEDAKNAYLRAKEKYHII